MKLHTILLSHLLLHTTEASTLPKLVRAELTRRTNHKESTLVWSKCDLDFGNEYLNEKQKEHECARLKVPLDYTNESNGETIELDLIKVKATAKPFKGSVLYNPGGPGASGVEITVDVGSLLSE